MAIPDLPAPPWVVLASIKEIDVSAQSGVLSESERQRYQRFRREDDRQRYLLAHVLKRLCLGRLVNCAPAALQFGVGRHGKPFCENPGAPQFNLSHAGHYVALAVAADSVGVDVEQINREVRQEVADRVLNQQQLRQLADSDSADETFMLFWTQKEAISKALGLGLSIGFESVSCSGQPGLQQLEQEGQKLSADSLLMDDGYALSVCSSAGLEFTVHRLISDGGEGRLAFERFR